jgi:hypothetical protein
MNFIDNLVHKAAGVPYLAKPNPLLYPVNELPAYHFISKSEGTVADTLEEISVIPEEGSILSHETSERIATNNIAGSPVYPKQESQGSMKSKKDLDPQINASNKHGSSKSDDFYAVDGGKLEKSIEVPVSPRKIYEKNTTPGSVTISPVVDRQPSNLTEEGNLDVKRSSLHLEPSTSEPDTGTYADHSIYPGLNTPIRDDISKKLRHEEVDFVKAANKIRIHKQPIEKPKEIDNFSSTRNNVMHFVNIEPVVRVSQQELLEDSKANVTGDIPSYHSEPSGMGIIQPQQEKEVRVNIGRVEINAPKPAPPKLNPPAQGFDDYLMMRVYLDRCCF